MGGEGPLDAFAAGRLPLTLAAMQAVLASADDAGLARELAAARARLGPALEPLIAALDPAAVERVRVVASALDHSFTHHDPAAVLARMARGFDAAAAVSPEAGAALYSLGDPERLAAATAEVVAWLRAERLFAPGARVLEVGCGAGRFLQALAGEAHLALGVEISAAMAREAARRLAARPGAGVVRGSGLDLGFVAAASLDLVLFADSFPYIVQAGGGLAGRMLAEAARVLRPGGAAAVLNWSYRGDRAADAAERAALASAAGLLVRPCPPPPFRWWDADASVLQRPAPAAPSRGPLPASPYSPVPAR